MFVAHSIVTIAQQIENWMWIRTENIEIYTIVVAITKNTQW